MNGPIRYALATTVDTKALIHYRILLLDTVSNRSHPDGVVENLRKDLAIYFPKAIGNGSYISWLAYSGADLVAVAGMVIYERPASYNCPTGKAGYILNIYTEPQYRRQGICSALIEKLQQSAIEKGISTLALHASDEGEPVYRKYGFAEPHSLVLEKLL